MDKQAGGGASSRVPIADDDRYLDRELSLLEFNLRVLAQAEDPALPLLERLRFLCIVSSNVDELFEVRMASLLAQHKIDSAHGDLSGIRH
jgi:polyphosphate kinase